MNTEKIRQEVFRRTGKAIDLDDPFFVAVTMLSAVTDDMEQKHANVLADLKNEIAAFHKSGIKVDELIQALRAVENKASVEELEKLIRRAYNNEVQATRWLTHANQKLDSFLPLLLGTAAISGVFIGATLALIQKFI